MMSKFQIRLFALMAMTLTSCTSMIKYPAQSDMSLEASREIMQEMILTQHRAWKPEYVEVTDKYMVWGNGAVFLGGVWTSKSTRKRDSSQRLYFKNVEQVGLFSWIRKFKRWIVVKVVLKDHRGSMTLLRTRNLDDAKRFTDALESLIALRHNQT